MGSGKVGVALLLIFILQTGPVKVFGLPSDPMVSSQWGWLRVGADKAFEAGTVQPTALGQGILVAVLDTGVDVDHQDLKANLDLANAWNFVDGNNNARDADGHGTMVAGVIGAITNNGIGIAGVASKVKILPIKVLTSKGGSSFNVDRAILYAADKGARVISMSLGGSTSQVTRLLDQLAIESALRRNVVLVAAAGNDNSNTRVYPAAYDGVIAVSAIDQTGKKASFSNYGSWISMAAPGVSIVSTLLNQQYGSGSGTSFATPFVSAAAAIVLSRFPTLTPSQVKQTLCSTAVNLGSPQEFYGCGLVNVAGAAGATNVPEFTYLTPAVIALSLAATVLIRRRIRQG